MRAQDAGVKPVQTKAREGYLNRADAGQYFAGMEPEAA
jgi:hypothetical protein